MRTEEELKLEREELIGEMIQASILEKYGLLAELKKLNILYITKNLLIRQRMNNIIL